MIKTAEEMFHEEFNVSNANGLVHTPPEFIISVMNRFAAQEVAKEVEAYKRRLIAEIRADAGNVGPTMLIGDIALIIDRVK